MTITKEELKNMVRELFDERNKAAMIDSIDNNINIIDGNKAIIQLVRCDPIIDNGKLKGLIRHLDIILTKEFLQ